MYSFVDLFLIVIRYISRSPYQATPTSYRFLVYVTENPFRRGQGQRDFQAATRKLTDCLPWRSFDKVLCSRGRESILKFVARGCRTPEKVY
jgi:hypothetical protein